MIRRISSSLLVLALVFASARPAWAFTVEELLAWTSDLHADLESLEVQATNCPNGECEERAQIEAAFGAAEDERLDLVAARASLGPCPTCGQLDSDLAAAAALSTEVSGIITTWEEQE